MNAITLNNVLKERGNFTLHIPNLEIKQGYITGFIGENGAGKTTTIKLIMGLLHAQQGSIEVLDQPITQNNFKVRDLIGYVGDPTGYPSETKLKHVKAMFSPFYSNWDESLYQKYIKHFQLDENKAIKDLSQGQNKQFALSMALAHRPKLIILDEPTANLDPVVRNYILSVLMEHMQDEEVSVFYSTHITSDLEKASDYIVYIQDGKILFNTEKETLIESHRIVKGPRKLLTPELEKHLIGCSQNSFGFEALTADPKEAFELFGNEAIYEKASIEDIMIYLERGKHNGTNIKTY